MTRIFVFLIALIFITIPATSWGDVSVDNCGGEFNDTIDSCKGALRDEATFYKSVNASNSFDIVNGYTLCSFPFIQNKLTAQEKDVLAKIGARANVERKTLTQKQLNQLNLAVAMTTARCEAKKTYSKRELDDLDMVLKIIWESMSNALAQNNIEKAVSYYVEGSRDLYRTQFNAFTQEVRVKIARDNLDAQLYMDKVQGNQAIYNLITTRNGQRSSFQLTFGKNYLGEWKIYSY